MTYITFYKLEQDRDDLVEIIRTYMALQSPDPLEHETIQFNLSCHIARLHELEAELAELRNLHGGATPLRNMELDEHLQVA